MGYHYVPQKYLRRFSYTGSGTQVWMYDKQAKVVRLVGIARVAQSRQFYTPEEEEKLASVVEGPADPVIEKLIDRQRLTDKERLQLAFYIAVMIRRVPYRRKKIYETIVPPTLRETFDSVRRELVTAAERAHIDPLVVSAHLAELSVSEESYLQDPPTRIHRAVRQPWPTAKIVIAIYDMAWRIVEAPRQSAFIACDNPAFYFEGYGLGKPESELTFPLSSTHCLHGSWQGPKGGLAFLTTNETFVREFNRRLASTTDRFAFYHEEAEWILRLLRKPKIRLNRIRW